MNTILWEVDAQADFMLAGGKLYVPGAEKIILNLNRLVECARQNRVLLISSADVHSPDDPEFREWPPHCVKGTAGAELIPEARAGSQMVIPNEQNFAFPGDLSAYQQILLEKNTLDVFDNPHVDRVLAKLNVSQKKDHDSGTDFLVFGVVTEYCVRYAAEGLLRRGFQISIVEDAIQSIDEKKGRAILDDLESRGARLISTKEALALIGHDTSTAPKSKTQKAAGT